MEPSISRSIDVAAPAEVVWSLVSDLPRMDRFSPENIGGRWVGVDGPALGARFRGTNRNGARTWHTTAHVVEFEDGRAFAFDVYSQIRLRVSRWGYVVTPTSTGCRLTENWYRVGNWFVRSFLGPKVTGRKDRPGFNTHSIEHTLDKVKAYAERLVQPGTAPGHTFAEPGRAAATPGDRQ
ncbi:MAG TPA: SRPBCC family protein [Pseudonocardiaceae bacterium]